MVWSPFSNIWLYGDTTDVLSARKHMRVCLGSDWSPSGTRNLLGELKVAALWNTREPRRRALSPLELCEMVTREPGLALEQPWGRAVGRLEPGALADVAVMTPAGHRPVQVGARRERAQREARDRRRRARLRRRFDDEGRRGSPARRSPWPACARRVRTKLPADRLPQEPDLRAAASLSWKAGHGAHGGGAQGPGGRGQEGAEEESLRRRAPRVRARHARVHRRRRRRGRDGSTTTSWTTS